MIVQPVVWIGLGIFAIFRLKLGEKEQSPRCTIPACCILWCHISSSPRMTCPESWEMSRNDCMLASDDALIFFADYLLIVVIAVVLSCANVFGYTKCSKEASNQFKAMATNAMRQGLTVRFIASFVPCARHVDSQGRRIQSALCKAW